MKKIKIFYILFLLHINMLSVFANLQHDMVPDDSRVIWNTWNGFTSLNWIVNYSKDFLFSILVVVVIWAFLYIWFKLVISRGNPEELKKSLLWFVYIILWMAVISLAWWIVKIVSSLDF